MSMIRKTIAEGIRRRLTGRTVVLIVGVIILAAVVQSYNGKFLTAGNFTTILQQISVSGVLAAGMTLVVITGGIDLSAGYGVTLGAILIGVVFSSTGNPLLAMAAGVGGCLVLGLVNGLLISLTGIAPFIVTLATMSLTQGALNLIGAGKRLRLKDPLFEYLGRTKYLGVSVTTLVMVAMLLLFAFILSRTRMGGYTYAIGSNEGNARLAGINVRRYKTAVYALSGLCMGISAILLGARTVLVTQNSGGSSLLMDALAAVILGGAKTSGGVGRMSGTFVGVLVLGMIGNALTMMNVPAQSQELFKGAAIILVLLIQPLTAMLAERWAVRGTP